VNLLAGRTYSEGGPAGLRPGWQPPVFDFDGALRTVGTVLEGIVTYRGDQSVPWQRQDVRLVHDRPKARVRTSLGDVNYGVSGFQSSWLMGGVAVTRSLELQRGRSSAPAAAKTLLLERRSRVEVWINGSA
jgi:outer membrane usher protein FimD/PapC